MDHRAYIQQRIVILTNSNRTFAQLSWIMVCVGIIFMAAPLLTNLPSDITLKYSGFGFGIFMLLPPLYLSNERAKRKIQILELKHLLFALSNNPRIPIEQDQILKKILEKL